MNGEPYNVKPVPITLDVDESVVKVFQIRSPRGDRYHVVQTTDGVCCDCPESTFHRADYDPTLVGRGCKHILGMIAVGLLSAVPR